jgi:hypothetical protein
MSIHNEGEVDLHPLTVVHEFPVNTFIENIAVRRSGQLVLTVHNKNEVLTVDPNAAVPSPAPVHVFETGVCGIVEMGEDTFFVSSGSIGEKGSWAIFKVEMSHFAMDSSGHVLEPAVVTKFVDIPDALFLNGSAALNHTSGVILAADSLLGTVFSVNVNTKEVKVWLQHKDLAKVTENPVYPGLNGIKFYGGYLYCSNTDAKTFLRASATATGEATGVVEVVEENLGIDDFAFDSEGSAYLTTHIFQSVVKLRSDGVRTRIAGGPEDTVTAGTTAAAFGRTSHDQKSLYVTTTGGMSLPVKGKVVGGKVLKIDVGHTGGLGQQAA